MVTRARGASRRRIATGVRVNRPRRTGALRITIARGQTAREVGPRGMLTIEEAAAFMRRSPAVVQRSIAAGFLPARRRGRELVVSLAACDRYLREEAADIAAVRLRRHQRRIPGAKVHARLGLQNFRRAAVAYAFGYSEEAARELARRPQRLRRAITCSVLGLTRDPEPAESEPLYGDWEGHRRLRVMGTLRILYRIDRLSKTRDRDRQDRWARIDLRHGVGSPVRVTFEHYPELKVARPPLGHLVYVHYHPDEGRCYSVVQ